MARPLLGLSEPSAIHQMWRKIYEMMVSLVLMLVNATSDFSFALNPSIDISASRSKVQGPINSAMHVFFFQ